MTTAKAELKPAAKKPVVYPVPLSKINLDVSIQCRATIDTGTVNEYAERMAEQDRFPPVVLFGTDRGYWVGDGWHRILAARQLSHISIEAEVRPGGRSGALKHALSSNAIHGNRRTNADKRRCVEIALKEFPKLSTTVLSDMCEVSDELVRLLKKAQVPTIGTSTVTGRDGKQYSSKRKSKEQATQPPTEEEQSHHEESTETRPPTRPVLGPPRLGMQYAWIAVKNLESIKPDDAEREQAFAHVTRWLENHWAHVNFVILDEKWMKTLSKIAREHTKARGDEWTAAGMARYSIQRFLENQPPKK